MSRSQSSKSTLILVAPANSSQEGSEFEVLSMDDLEENGGRNVQFSPEDDVVIGNPELGGDFGVEEMELNDLPSQPHPPNDTNQEMPHPPNDTNQEVPHPPDNILPPVYIDEQMLQDVLDTRPTLQKGRQRSLYHSKGSIHRPRPRSRAMTTVMDLSIPGTRAGVFRDRSATLPVPSSGRQADGSSTGLPSIINVEDFGATEQREEGEEDEEEGVGFSAGDKANLRRSTRTLKERIDMHRESQKPTAVVRESAWDNLKDVKWPKWKSRGKVLLSWELWKGHMKEVEGHFGTAVVSYFIFLRFIFLMNVVIFALWFGFVVIPGIVYIQVSGSPNVPSQLACVYSPANDSRLLCPTDSTSIAGTNETLVDGTFYYQLAVAGQYSCNMTTSAVFSVQSCSFGDALTVNESLFMVAESESSETVSVSSVPPDEGFDCDFQQLNASVRRLRICPGLIAPNTLWYEYIIDFVLGQGIFNDTILFYGRYNNSNVVGNTYSMPLAYLLAMGAIYAVSVLLLVYKLGTAYNESYTQVSNKNANFCNKVFTAWDFNITNPNTAKLKRVHIRTDFEEEVADYEKRNLCRSGKEIAKVVLIRCVTNLFTILVLAAGSAAIFFAAQFGLDNPNSTFEGLVLPVVITALNLVLPFLFSFLAQVEKFKTQSGEIKMTLLRAIIVRLSSLIVLVITLFILVSCTQGVQEDTGTCQFTISIIVGSNNSAANNTAATAADCPVCWETFIGQEFYKLGLTNFVVSAFSTIAAETARNIASRFKFKGLGAKLGKGNFNIAKSILDLIYTQALLWLGFFFSPLLPAVIMLTSFVLFYVKKYSLVYNLTPDKRGTFRASRTNFLFILLMLMSLFLILLPIGYIIGSFNPSETCGPFRGNRFIFTVVTDLVDSFNCAAQQAIDFFGSVGFVVPVIILLLLMVYSQFVILRARKERFGLIKKQLILEGANVTHIVGRLDGVLRNIADQRELATSAPGSHTKLQQRILDVRNSVSDVAASSSL